MGQRVLASGTRVTLDPVPVVGAPQTVSLSTIGPPAPSASVALSSLHALGAIDAGNQPVDMRKVYDFAWSYGMPGPDVDLALSWPPGTLDAWVSEHRFVPIMTMHDTTVVPVGWQPPPLNLGGA